MSELLIVRRDGSEHVVLYDPGDHDYITSHRWHIREEGPSYFTCATNLTIDGRRTVRRMHTLLTGWSLVDHANRNALDNRRSNLRPADKRLNGANKIGSAKSGFKGVVASRHGTRWISRIMVDQKSIYLGCFPTPEDAARAYDEAAITAWGEYALINYPKESAAC